MSSRLPEELGRTAQMSKVIIAGSRDIEWYNIERLMEHAQANLGFSHISEVVSGCAPGIDSLGIQWAEEKAIPIMRFPADWAKHGRAAGPIRNRQMAEYVGPSGYLVCVWDGKSRGTRNMIEERSEEHTSELQSRENLVCRLLLEK